MAIALLTDFGLRDPYVGIMKGAIAQIAPGVPTIDLSHQIPPQDIAAGRFALASAIPYLPIGTVILAVVDPGVGSARRGLAIACDRGWLVGPDNGLFGGVLAQFPAREAVTLENPAYWLQPQASTTFHGRDIFAPVAAHLAVGVPLAALGPAALTAGLVDLPLPPYRETAAGWTGVVQYIDGFGNAATNIPGNRAQGATGVRVGNHRVPLGHTYSDVPPGQPVVLIGSHGWLEIAVNGGRAVTGLGLELGTEVSLIRKRQANIGD